jgi:TonB family protein
MAGMLPAQSADNAADIIRNLAHSAADATSWKIDGAIIYSPIPAGGVTVAVPFTLLVHSPNQSYFEHLGGPSPSLIVCDGANAWIYSPPFHRYAKRPAANNPSCAPMVADWKLLAADLESPTLSGRCGSDPTKSSDEFQLITGSSKPELPTAAAPWILRTLCIDPDRNLVLWETAKLGYNTRTYMYTQVDRNADIAPDRFVFKPPPGSTQTEIELPVLRPLGARVLGQRPGVVPPHIVSKKEPKYDGESRKERVQGTVLIWVIIDTRGMPSEVLVARSLNRKLDEAAIKAVRQWRFAPGTLNGKPVEVFATIEVNFRLL